MRLTRNQFSGKEQRTQLTHSCQWMEYTFVTFLDQLLCVWGWERWEVEGSQGETMTLFLESNWILISTKLFQYDRDIWIVLRCSRVIFIAWHCYPVEAWEDRPTQNWPSLYRHLSHALFLNFHRSISHKTLKPWVTIFFFLYKFSSCAKYKYYLTLLLLQAFPVSSAHNPLSSCISM